MIMLLIHRLFRLLPPLIRESIKQMLFASGHRRSVLDLLRAKSHAVGKKRIDRVAERLLTDFTVAGLTKSFNRDRCMEFGAGYVPSELLIYLALGARQVVAVDLNPIARLDYLKKSATNAPEGWLNNLGQLTENFNLNLNIINQFNINDAITSDRLSYAAPFDVSQKSFESAPFDFIHSVSVLEHLPLELVNDIAINLCNSLAPGGKMIHVIDLTDHRDAELNPFEFLRENSNYNSLLDFDARGNGLRLFQWLEIFSAIQGFVTTCIASKSLPLGFPIGELRKELRCIPIEKLSISEITLLISRHD